MHTCAGIEEFKSVTEGKNPVKKIPVLIPLQPPSCLSSTEQPFEGGIITALFQSEIIALEYTPSVGFRGAAASEQLLQN